MAYIDQRSIDEMKRTLEAFEPAKNKRAISRARSTAIRDTKSETGKGAAKALALRSKAASPKSVKQSITSKNKADSGQVEILGKYIRGSLFQNELVGPVPAKQLSGLSGGSAPVGVRFFAGDPIKKQKGYFRTRKSKYKASPIMKRKGRARHPLVTLWGPTVFDVYGSGTKGKKRQAEILEFGGLKYESELSRQIDLALREL